MSYSEFFWSECGKIRTRKTPNTDTFHTLCEAPQNKVLHEPTLHFPRKLKRILSTDTFPLLKRACIHSLCFNMYFRKFARKSKSEGRILKGLHVSFKYNQSSAVCMTSNMSGQTMNTSGQIMLIYCLDIFTCVPV